MWWTGWSVIMHERNQFEVDWEDGLRQGSEARERERGTVEKNGEGEEWAIMCLGINM